MHDSVTAKSPDVAPGLRSIREGVSWDEYERILAGHGRNGSLRVTYDRGTVEIARLSPRQKETIRVLSIIVTIAAPALHIAIGDLGATTCRRSDLRRGFDPDASFSIQNTARMMGNAGITSAHTSPPDLILQSHPAASSMDKLPVLAAFGVPEIWRYEETGDRVAILRLIHGHYQERRESAALVPLTSDLLTRLVHDRRSRPFEVWNRELESWLRTYD